jgi:hypothetical protein
VEELFERFEDFKSEENRIRCLYSLFRYLMVVHHGSLGAVPPTTRSRVNGKF